MSLTEISSMGNLISSEMIAFLIGFYVGRK